MSANGTPMTTGDPITVRARHRSIRRSGFVVELDPRLPEATCGRTVYHSPDSRFLSAPHVHDAPHELLCLAGSCAVGLAPREEQPVTWLRIEQGGSCLVPPRVAHRIWMDAGAVLASVDRATSWLATGGVEQLAADERWQR